MTVIVAGGMGIVGYTQTAGAEPQPTISQVQATVNKLQSQVDQVGTQLDQASSQLSEARAKLSSVQHQQSSAEKQFFVARASLRNVAVATYEDQGQSSVAGLLSTASPDAVLQQAGLLQELGNMHAQQADRFLGAAQAVENAQAQFKRTEEGIAQLQSGLQAKKAQLNKLLSKSQDELNSLGAAELQQVAQIGGGTCHASDPYGTSTSGLQAVKFAFEALCLPYEWGGTGPSAYDCSGLTQAAWASAGVSIPRDTYSQWAALPHVSKSDLEPGDLLFFESLGHVGIYVGGGMMIDAPATGQVVTLHSINEAWYADNYVGAARP